MAFLVCYSKSLSDHTRNKAIYLDQQFYEMIFRHCRSESSGFELLREIAMLRYKSPTLLIMNDRLGQLTQELAQLEYDNIQYHQISGFRNVCQVAIESNDSLTISGDMSQELDR